MGCFLRIANHDVINAEGFLLMFFQLIKNRGILRVEVYLLILLLLMIEFQEGI